MNHYHVKFSDTRKCGECREQSPDQWGETLLAAYERKIEKVKESAKALRDVDCAFNDVTTRERDEAQTLLRVTEMERDDFRDRLALTSSGLAGLVAAARAVLETQERVDAQMHKRIAVEEWERLVSEMQSARVALRAALAEADRG